MHKILAVCGGNGAWLYPLKEFLIGNLEPRSLFKTPDDIQWRLNFNSIPLYHKLEEIAKLKPSIIVGAPDCGHSSKFSYSRAKKLSSPLENSSFKVFLDSVLYLSPSYFVMENLEKALEYIEDIRDWLPTYIVDYIKFNSFEIGNSQINRDRVLIIGVRKDKNKGNLVLLKRLKQISILKRTKNLLEDFPNEKPTANFCHIKEKLEDTITLYAGFKLSLVEIKEEWKRRGTSRWKVEGKKFSTAPGVYRNLPDEYPATVRKTNRQFNSEGEMMSPRELGRIQGIPDSFKVWEDTSKLYYCINKGRVTVAKGPPYELGLLLKDKLEKGEFD